MDEQSGHAAEGQFESGPDEVADLNETERPAFETPRLTFVAPKLAEQGSLHDVTHGFFGTFSI